MYVLRTEVGRAALAAVWFTASSIFASAYADQVEFRLDNQKIAQHYAGRAVYLRWQGADFTLIFSEDGRLDGKTDVVSDSGRWWTDDDKMCRQWRRWHENRVVCHPVVAKGELHVWHLLDGSIVTVRMMPG